VKLEETPDDDDLDAALNEIYGELKGVRPNKTKRKAKPKMDHERKGKKGRRSPVVDYVRSLGDYRTASEVAEELECSVGLIRKLANNRVTQAPSYVAPFGTTHVNLYTKSDVAALKEYLEANRKIYTRDEFDEKR